MLMMPPSEVVCTCVPVPHVRQGVDTGAGMIVFDSPVAVPTVVSDGATHDDEAAQVRD